MSFQSRLVFFSIVLILVVVDSSNTTVQPVSFTSTEPYECAIGEFKCVNSSGCIPQSYKCDGMWDCADGEDEAESVCTGPYTCLLISSKLTVEGLIQITKSQDFGEDRILTEDEASEIVTLAEGFAASGVDVQDHVTLASLLLTNVIISIFIIIGLISYDEKKQFQNIDISYVVIIIIILQHMLISSINIFSTHLFYCTINGREVVSPFDVIQYLSSLILWLIWVRYLYNGKRSKKCCAVYVFLLTFAIPFILILFGGVWVQLVRVGGGWGVFMVCQIALPIVWLLLLMQEANKLNGVCPGCVNLQKLCGNAAKWQQYQTWCCIGCVMFILQFAALIAWIIIEPDTPNMCMAMGGLSWLNPIWVVLCIVLLFTSARFPIIMYNVLMLIISMFGIEYGYLCEYVVNVNFAGHSLFIPMYMILLFFSVPELTEWKQDLIQMYLVAFDIVTDIIVIKFFIETEEYIFATLSIMFIVLGQIVGSFSQYCIGDKSERFIITKTDKILSALGFSAPWFIIKSWSDREYFLLQHKHQIWEIMFENMPGVALQIYAAITQSTGDASLAISITVSTGTITFSIWNYLVKLTRLKRQMSIRSTLEDNADTTANSVELKASTATDTDALPHGWREVSTFDGKIYYQNDTTKHTQWTKPVAPPPDALPHGWRKVYALDGKMYYQNDITKQTQWTNPNAVTAVSVGPDDDDEEPGKEESNPVDDDTTDAALTVKGRRRVMTTEQFEFEEGMDKLKTSRVVPKFVREKFAEVLIHRTLFINLYLFMISDFYLRSMSIVIFISSIPCPVGSDFCAPRIGVGSALFLGLLIFAFIMNKRMRIDSYQKCCFISTIFAVSLLSSFYNILSSLKILKDDKFFGKSVNFESFLLEHKIRFWISFSLNITSVCFFFLYDSSRNAFIGTLMILFFVALAINYFSITKVALYIDSDKKYVFNMFKCKESEESDENKEDAHEDKVPVVIIHNKEDEAKVEETAKVEKEGMEANDLEANDRAMEKEEQANKEEVGEQN